VRSEIVLRKAASQLLVRLEEQLSEHFGNLSG